MASLRVSLSLLLFLGAVYQAQALQCYACNDCESGYEDSLMTCQIPEMPTTVSTSTSTESTSASTSTSTESTSASTSTSTESTSPSESTSTESTSPSESTSTESTSPSESTSTESTSPSESTSTESTSPSESTSTESTSPSESTSTESTSPSESTSTESTSPSESTSTESTSASTSTSTESTSASTSTSTESTSPSTSTTSSGNGNPDVQMRFRRYVKQVRADAIQPRCVVTSYEENGQKKTNRGCTIGVEGMTDEVRCRLVAGGFTGDLSRCHVCNEDKCNSATKSAIAFVPFLIGIISYLLN
ncbi:uncharacterized protein [Maniola hyperantus]|uniref:uncharacterized protein isoform X1 n=2 Tax=Aphantopus hyperantus TaxID=2795564 RepID=UPI002139E02B